MRGLRGCPLGLPAFLLLTAVPTSAQCGLLSWDEYRQTHHSFPYVVRLEGKLVLFGARHTRDPRDSQLAEIERLWREFRPQVAFSEGGVRPAAASREEAVFRFGEPGLLRLLADRDHVSLRSLEPSEDAEAASLAKRFAPEQVKLFYFLRAMSTAADADPQGVLDSVHRRQRLAGPPNTIREVSDLMPQADWRHVPEAWLDPTRSDGPFHEIPRASTDYRNCHMAALLIDAVRSGKRVFVVVGGTHAVVLEPALNAAIPQHAGCTDVRTGGRGRPLCSVTPVY